MKKQLILALLAVATSFSAFGQGFILFQSTKAAGVWYSPNQFGGSNSVAQLGNNGIDVGFLWAASPPQTPGFGSSGSSISNTVPGSWGPVLNDPNFHFATNASGGTFVASTVNNSGVTQGGWTYNGGVSFGLQGTAGGQIVDVVAIAWSSLYANPWDAAAGGSFVGWGNTIAYTLGTGTSSTTFAAAGSTAFGVQPVPEPATFALAGLGAAAMLIFRRRK